MSVRNTVSFTRLAAVHPLAVQRHREVCKHLLRLCGEIMPADHIAVAVERGLAGDEDDTACADLDDLGIARRRAESGGLMRRIDGVCFTGRAACCGGIQLRGAADTGGGPRPIAFFGFSVPA